MQFPASPPVMTSYTQSERELGNEMLLDAERRPEAICESTSHSQRPSRRADMSKSPYVSFVTYGRNDGYTASYARRVNRALVCLARQLENARLDSEIIFTEWNPPSDRQLLMDVLELPNALQHVSIRGIIVGPEHHKKLAGSDERNIQVGEAANVGIRRARGRFITAKASDTFFSPDVIAMIAQKNLDIDTMYRIDRHDISIADDAIWELDDDALLAKLASLPSRPHALIRQKSYWGLRNLHTNACGDFTLMSDAHWHLLRGHPKDTTVLSLDLDSLVMHAAAANGVRECRWPESCRLYKPSHGSISTSRVKQVWRPWQRHLDRFLADKVGEVTAHHVRTLFDYPRRRVVGVDSILGPSFERNLVRPARRWAMGQRQIPTQPENWGLADIPLEQRTLCRASWEIVA